MCQTRNSRLVVINDKQVRVDACLKGLISALNMRGIVTLGCCCGHGKYPITIVIKHGFGYPVELCSGRRIPRTKKFYKKGCYGWFFIPEVHKEDDWL